MKETEIRVACNPFNVLCGERGVTRVFGPQKGATPTQVEQPAAGLGRGGEFLTDATERALRMIVLGSRLRTAPQPDRATPNPDQALAVSGTQRPSSVR